MILPLRVFGKVSQKRTSAGRAIVPIAVHGAAPSMDNACEVAFPGVAAHGSPEEPNNAFSWNCYEGAPPPPEETNGGGGGKTGSGGGPTAKTSVLTTPITMLAAPAPVLAHTGNVAPVAGNVRVRLPGTTTFVALATLEQVPFGSVIDATDGTVSVTVALPGGTTQTGQFFDGAETDCPGESRRTEPVASFFLELQQSPRIAEQHLAVIGQRHRSCGAAKQRPFGFKLEPLDLLADGRLGEIQLLGGAMKAAAFGDRDKRAKQFKFQHIY